MVFEFVEFERYQTRFFFFFFFQESRDTIEWTFSLSPLLFPSFFSSPHPLQLFHDTWKKDTNGRASGVLFSPMEIEGRGKKREKRGDTRGAHRFQEAWGRSFGGGGERNACIKEAASPGKEERKRRVAWWDIFPTMRATLCPAITDRGPERRRNEWAGGKRRTACKKGTEKKVVEMERVSRKFMSKCLVSRKLIVDSSYVCGRFVCGSMAAGFRAWRKTPSCFPAT